MPSVAFSSIPRDALGAETAIFPLSAEHDAHNFKTSYAVAGVPLKIAALAPFISRVNGQYTLIRQTLIHALMCPGQEVVQVMRLG